MDEDVVDARGVVFKNTSESGCPPTCDDQAHRLRARQGGACKGEGEAHLLIDDADVVLGAISFQGPGAGLTMPGAHLRQWRSDRS